MSYKVHSDWFGQVSVDATDSSRAAFDKVEKLLTGLQPAAAQRARSTAAFTAAGVQIVISHMTDPKMTIELNFDADGGGMFHPGGFEEYYRLRGEPPVEQDALDNLTATLTNTYVIEDTRWKGRVIRTKVTTQDSGGEHTGTSVSGWLLPPRWVLPRNHVTTQSRTVSFGCRPAHGAAKS